MTLRKKIDLERNLIGYEDKENEISVMINPNIEILYSEGQGKLIEYVYNRLKKERDEV
jgi:hypothetical protein